MFLDLLLDSAGGLFRCGRFGRAIHLVLQILLLLLQIGNLLLQIRVLRREVLQQLFDFIQFVEALENIRAAGTGTLFGCHRLDGFGGPSRAHRTALLVGYREDNAPVHPSRDIGLTVMLLVTLRLGIGGAAAGYFHLFRLRAVLNQKVANRVGAFQTKLVVVAGTSEVIGVALDLDVIRGVRAQQIRQPQQARITVGQDRRVKLEINLFPVILRRFRIQTLRGCEHANQAQKYYVCSESPDHLSLLWRATNLRPPLSVSVWYVTEPSF